MKIIHISDTHLREFPKLEPADLLVHSGDALSYGTIEELYRFNNQLKYIAKDYTQILFIPGNHDWVFQHNPTLAINQLENNISNLKVLIHDEYIFNNIKVFGSSFQPFFCNWAFNLHSWDLKPKYDTIPEDTELLITHCPPKGTLDYVKNAFNPEGNNVGSPELANRIKDLKNLKANLFGHIHYAHGMETKDGIIYSNASICDESYDSVNKANIFDIE